MGLLRLVSLKACHNSIQSGNLRLEDPIEESPHPIIEVIEKDDFRKEIEAKAGKLIFKSLFNQLLKKGFRKKMICKISCRLCKI